MPLFDNYELVCPITQYFRPHINTMASYVSPEQPQGGIEIIKLILLDASPVKARNISDAGIPRLYGWGVSILPKCNGQKLCK